MEKDERKDHRERHPDSELLIDRQVGEGVEEKKPGTAMATVAA